MTDGLDNLISNHFTPWVRGGLEAAGASSWAVSLVCDGVIAGVGSIVSFFPQILLLFLFLSILEDSGYMARAAFIMDKLLHKTRLVRPLLCPHADGVRMLGARRHGRSYLGKRAGPPYDDYAHALHVLLCENAGLRPVYRRLFPQIQGPGGIRLVCAGAGGGDPGAP